MSGQPGQLLFDNVETRAAPLIAVYLDVLLSKFVSVLNHLTVCVKIKTLFDIHSVIENDTCRTSIDLSQCNRAFHSISFYELDQTDF